MATHLRFPDDFVFGMATSAYQIEGAVSQDGRIPSQWDIFSHTPGRTFHGDTGDVACDHYHRYGEDVALMAKMGVPSYRFSFAWPRIFTVDRRINQKGLDFYHRLLDELDQHQITPMATLYHWDLPGWLADRGGWVNRDTIGYFMDYAEVLFRTFGDRIPQWITHNEPWCTAFLGYALGEHAPGHHDWSEAIRASHHVLVSHGEVVKGYRGMGLKGQIGITLNLSVVDPKTDSEADQQAAVRADGFQNRWFLDPILKQGYPADMIDKFQPYVRDDLFIRPHDMDTIQTPIDFLGVNYYTRAVVYADQTDPVLGVGQVIPPPECRTTMGWEVHPESLYRLLKRIHQDYTTLPLYITENGAAFSDQVSEEGQVHDSKRQQFIQAHLEAAHQFIKEGGPLKGYYLWSLFDNFEWAHGYSQRFGVVYVDFVTQQRITKDSGLWYRDLVLYNRK